MMYDNLSYSNRSYASLRAPRVSLRRRWSRDEDSNDRVTPHSARSGNRASCASGAPVIGARIKRRHGPERPRYSRPPTRLSASPVQETGLAVLDQLTPGQLAQADIEHRRQEQAEQGDPD